MKRVLFGLALAFFLCSGMAMAADAPGGFCPAIQAAPAAGVPGALAPVLMSGCTETFVCADGFHLSCSSRFPDECGPLFTCGSFIQCGVTCFPQGDKFCAGYNSSNCAC
jgi:hypothetical protein